MAASAAEEATTLRGERVAPAPTIARARSRFWTVVTSHLAVDLYAGIVPALSVALAARLGLSAMELTALFVINSVMSGVSQPVFAWLTDRLDTRLCAPVGLALAAAALCAIGFADNFAQLVALQVVGQIGVGMYHPIGAALTGQLGRGMRFGRSMAVTIFFTAGMAGSVAGPVLVTRMNESAGLMSLLWLIPPGLLFAAVLFGASARVPHRHALVTQAVEEPPERAALRRRAVRILFWAAVLRFGVNNAVYFLMALWAKARITGDADAASSLTGELFALTSVGMAAAALAGGRFVRAGHEKRPMVVLPLLGAPIIAAMGLLSPDASWTLPLFAAAAFVSAAGYAASAPLAISAAQRLMPGNTGVASSLMMGGAWTLSAGFPFLVQGAIALGTAVTGVGGLWAGFLALALLLAANGVLSMALPSRLMRETADC